MVRKIENWGSMLVEYKGLILLPVAYKKCGEVVRRRLEKRVEEMGVIYILRGLYWTY